MYFIKYQPLKNKLKTRSVSDREALPYFLVYSALIALIGAFQMLDDFNRWDFFSRTLSVLIAILGVLYIYKSNGGKDGFDLIHKYMVLGWVVSVRCVLIILPLAIVAYITGDFYGLIRDETGIFDVVIIALIEIFICQRIGRHIRDTRKS